VIRERLVKHETEGGQAEVVSVGEEAEVAYLHEAFWEDMLKETVDEFIGREGAELDLAGVGRAIAEGDLVVLELDETAVGDGDAEDIGGQVFEGRASIANGFAMDNPLMFPGRGRQGAGERRLLECVEELGSEDLGKGLHREEETMMSWEPGAVIGGQGASWDKIVYMGMIGKVAAPGVQNAEHTNLSTHETRVTSQELGGSCGCAEQQIVEEGLVGTGK
jgi:hypothetical protein